MSEPTKKDDGPFAPSIAALKVVFEWAATIPKRTGGQTVLECPTCKGKLHVAKISYNGHVRAQCETPGCVQFMQ